MFFLILLIICNAIFYNKIVNIDFFYQKKIIPIYIISLDKSNNRKKFLYNNIKLPYSYFRAVDGKNMNPNEVNIQNYIIFEESKLNYGERGCFISHYILWNIIVKLKHQYTLILEDDITFTISNQQIDKIINEIINLQSVKDFDIFYLGYCVDENSEPIDNIQNFNIHKSTWPWCTYSYILSYNGAIKLLDYFNNNKSTGPIDQILVDLINRKIINSYSISPPIITTSSEYSIIDETGLRGAAFQ